MAETRITDIFDPEVFDSYSLDRVIAKSALIDCGLAVEVPRFNQFLAGPGTTVTAPHWNAIVVSDEPNVSGDDPAVTSTPKKFTTRTELAIRQSVNQSWSTMNLAVDIAGSDPMNEVLTQTTAYWNNDLQLRAFKTALALLLDSIANFSGDLVNDVSSVDAGSAVVDGNLFSADAFLDADATMGEYMGELSGFLTHPIVFNRMRKLDLIDFIPASEGDRLIPTYMGARIFLYNNAPTVTYDPGGGNLVRYYSVLFAPGSFGLGRGVGKNPSAIAYDEAAGNGAGQETLYDRKQWVVHPRGYTWTSSSMAGESPTYAELALAVNWTRTVPVGDRERIGIAGLLTNG